MSQELIRKLNIHDLGESKEVQLPPGVSQLDGRRATRSLLADALVSRQHARFECDAGINRIWQFERHLSQSRKAESQKPCLLLKMAIK